LLAQLHAPDLAYHFHGDHLLALLLKYSAEQLNTLVNFESALLGLDGQFSVGVNNYMFSGESADPYEIEGFQREAVKVAFNTLINRDSSKHKGMAAKSLARNLNITMVQATSLENALYRLHHRIAGHFNTGYGLRLQKLDSQIAYDVMAHFFIEIKRPLLMIHDSAIVSVRDVETLKLCMVDSYRSVVLSELQKNQFFDDEYEPIPKGLKIISADFNSTLTNIIYRALQGTNVCLDEWSIAMKAS
jgi:hypothetical protein